MTLFCTIGSFFAGTPFCRDAFLQDFPLFNSAKKGSLYMISASKKLQGFRGNVKFSSEYFGREKEMGSPGSPGETERST